VRDSKDPAGPALMLSPDEWCTFTAGVKIGEPAARWPVLRAGQAA
jgi:hypothetical protein